jgi:plastocyanin
LRAGGSFSLTFENPGTYEYCCSVHPGIGGVVIVEG